MAKTVVLTLLLLSKMGVLFAQENYSKENLVATLTENLSPNINGTDFYENKTLSALKEKYNIDFHFSKINSVDKTECVVSFNDGDNLMTAALTEGDDYPYDLFNPDKTVYVKAKFVKFLLDKKNPLNSQARFEYKIYGKAKQAQSGKDEFAFKPQTDLKSLKELTLYATHYYVHKAAYSSTGIPLKNKRGEDTGVKLNLCDWCDAAIEGTVYTTDSSGKQITLNYATTGKTQQVDCSKCDKYKNYKNKKVGYTLWYEAKGKFGDGVQGYQLVPFRTIAVDKTQIPIGSVLFIPEAVGTTFTLSDGSKWVHDGYFFAADVGGDIKGNHIDVFTVSKNDNPFQFVKSDKNKTFKAYMVTDMAIKEALAKSHKPN